MICDYFMRDGILWVILPPILDETMVRELPSEFDRLEDKFGMPPRRIIDMRKVEVFAADFLAIEDLTVRRKQRLFPGPIKSAILVEDDLHVGIGRMYQNFIDHPQISVEVFRDEASAFDWLKSATPR
jgi:hypothetical protein